jgi:DNA polymerase-3 subunit beta
MRFVAKVNALAAAVAFAQRGADDRAKVAVLGCALLQAYGDGIAEVTGCTSTRCHTATIRTITTEETGAAAVPCERLTGLLGATLPDSEITFATAGSAVTVGAGGSRYRLPALPADAFPALLAPGRDAITLTLSAADVAMLLTAPAAIASDEATRPNLGGVYLHTDGGRVTGVATDGLRLVSRTSTIETADWPGIIIPTATVGEISRLARRHDSIELITDGRIVEARAGAARIASKLVDGIFPDYASCLPPPAATAADFDAGGMRAALARLIATSARDDNAAVGLRWDGGGALSLCLANEADIASDTIGATTTGNGRTACSAAMLSGLTEAIGAKRVRLSIEDKPDAILRFDAPDDSSAVAMLAPVYWRGDEQ